MIDDQEIDLLATDILAEGGGLGGSCRVQHPVAISRKRQARHVANDGFVIDNQNRRHYFPFSVKRRGWRINGRRDFDDSPIIITASQNFVGNISHVPVIR